MTAITQRSVEALARDMAGGLSAVAIAQAYLAQIDAHGNKTGAYLTRTDEIALSQAAAIDRRREAGESLPPLAGIPAAYKDNLCTRGVRTTCASRMLADYAPPYTATAIQRMEAHGAIMLGKTNMDEFGMGSSTENSALGVTRNPLDPSRVPGGSSGGSAAAVAAGEAAFALGSDTGGSIRQPAAFCGIVGMKPTYGAVSRYGLVAFASSLDQVGPLTRTVRDSALVLDALAGHDPRDSTSANRPLGGYGAKLEKGVRGLTLAVLEMPKGIDADVAAAVEGAARRYECMGAVLQPVSLRALDSALPAYYILSSAEASSNLARYDGVRYGHRAAEYDGMDDLYAQTRSEGFGAEVKRRILLGTFALSAGYRDAYYHRAQRVREAVRAEFARVLADCDAILLPTAPTVAYRLGEKTADPLSMYAGDICTVPASIAGLPALSMPCGVGAGGMPVGLQLIGRAFDEATLYRIAYALEREGM